MGEWEPRRDPWDVVDPLPGPGDASDGEGEAMGPDAEKRRAMNAYDDLNRRLNALKFGRFAFFLNYGYVPDRHPTSSVVSLPPGHFDANSRRLVLEVIGDCPVDGRDVLDVSCGRGSVATVLRDYFHPRSYVGLDISSEAIAFCRKHHAAPGVSFEQGDAEAMPVGTAAFDVVVNIEASHTYPSMASFVREVRRVLRPGGSFLYADFGRRHSFERGVGLLRAAGFELWRDVDITSNVLLSCEETAARRLRAYREPEERAVMADFLAAPGSRMHRAFQAGSLCYRVLTFRKAPGGAESRP